MAEGFLSPEETSIIQGALDLTSLTARHAMTPLDKVSNQLDVIRDALLSAPRKCLPLSVCCCR